MYKKIFMTAALILLTAASLFPFDGEAGESTVSTFSLNVVLDTSIIAAAAGLNGAVIYFDKVENVNRDDFDGNIYDPLQVNSFDQLLMNPHSMVIDDIGTYIAIASMLTPSILLTAPKDQWITIGTMYAETIALAYGVKELGKLCINRARPFMYYNSYPQQAVDDCDWNKSFPSGHTTLAFAGAVFTGYVFNEYFPYSKWKRPITGASYLAAVATAACRVASGNHFLTDVIAGAAAGAACGFLVPWLHSLNLKTEIAVGDGGTYLKVQAMPSGLLLTMKY